MAVSGPPAAAPTMAAIPTMANAPTGTPVPGQKRLNRAPQAPPVMPPRNSAGAKAGHPGAVRQHP